MFAGIDVSPLLEQSMEEDLHRHLSGQLAANPRRRMKIKLLKLLVEVIVIITLNSCH